MIKVLEILIDQILEIFIDKILKILDKSVDKLFDECWVGGKLGKNLQTHFCEEMNSFFILGDSLKQVDNGLLARLS